LAVLELPIYRSDKTNYHLVEDTKGFVQKVLIVDKPKRIAFDTETYYNPELKAPEVISKWIQASRNNVPFGVSFYYGGQGYWVDKDIHELKPLLECGEIDKIAHNAKYDLFMLKNLGLEVKGRIWDTMLMIHLIDEEFECKMPSGGVKRSKALKNLAFHFLGDDAHYLEDMVDEYRRILAHNRGLSKSDISYKDVNDVNPELMKDYAVADTEFTYRLFEIFLPELTNQQLERAYEIDIEATKAVIDMERNGVPVNREAMEEDEKLLTKIIRDIADIVHRDIACKDFNYNSDKELVDVFEELGVKWEWFTDKGELQTDKSVLKGIMNNEVYAEKARQLAGFILDIRKAEKLLSTYIIGIYPYIQEDGRVHADFNINPNDFDKGGTKTGRMSSNNPNLQNISKKPVKLQFLDGTDIEFKPRRYFVAEEGAIMVFMDADQEEYRMLAHYGNDKAFMDLIHKGYDIHKGTASLLFHVPYEEVTDDQRSKGKTTNFGQQN